MSWNENKVFHSLSRDENKVSDSVSRGENIDVCPVWSLHGDFHTAVASRVPDHHSLIQQFVKHAHGCLSHTQVCLTSDIASLKTIGQCTSALVKVPGSLCQFIKDSRVRVRLTRRGRDTCRFLDSCFQHNSDRGFAVAVASDVQSQNQTRRQVVHTQHGCNQIVVCLEDFR